MGQEAEQEVQKQERCVLHYHNVTLDHNQLVTMPRVQGRLSRCGILILAEQEAGR